MATTVKIKQSQLDYFRAQARLHSDKEIMAYLVGEVESQELTTVDHFAYTREYAQQTGNTVQWYADDYNRVYKQAEERGRRIVGWIHSHPKWDAVMSPADHLVCISEGSRICGIVSVHDRKTRVRFWVPDSALPCEIEYV